MSLVVIALTCLFLEVIFVATFFNLKLKIDLTVNVTIAGSSVTSSQRNIAEFVAGTWIGSEKKQQ